MTGVIFDIKELSLNDGPGGRVTVFLKGCPLRCLWCHNPEGLSPKPEIMVKTTLCEGCGRCRKPCTHPVCKGFDRCVYACPKGLVSVAGKEISVEELSKKLGRYRSFFEHNGGGITFSGGEPLLQTEFVAEVCKQLSGIHKAVETSGYAPEETFRKLITSMDYVMMDIKLADPQEHKQYTGVDNVQILHNFQLLKESGVPFVIRVPLIPGITDTKENLQGISKIVGDAPVELLSYNPFAGAKYSMVGKKYPLDRKENEAVDLTIFQNARLK